MLLNSGTTKAAPAAQSSSTDPLGVDLEKIFVVLFHRLVS